MTNSQTGHQDAVIEPDSSTSHVVMTWVQKNAMIPLPIKSLHGLSNPNDRLFEGTFIDRTRSREAAGG